MKPFAPEVFRAYDIRGLAGEDFDGPWVRALGLACGRWFAARGHGRAAVGFDVRRTSPEYAAQAVRGLNLAGVDAVVLGMVPTPLFYHACVRLRLPAGIMVTASHNPPEYNGFKLWGGQTALSPEAIGEVAGEMERTLAEVARKGWPEPPRPGLSSMHDHGPDYLDAIAEAAGRLEEPEPGRAYRVVVDGGNGAAGEVCARALERCGAEVDRLFTEPDGGFPNHHPDPVVEANARHLQRRVLDTGADLGLGLDGDGDRLGVVDETDRLVPGDEITALLARDVLARHPGALILGDVKCSHRLFADIEAHGGEACMAPTGHSLMKLAMLDTGALLAGEMSGHFCFGPPWIGTDDAVYGACVLAGLAARAMRRGQGPFSGLLTGWPAVESTPEIRTPCPEGIKFQVVRLLAEHLAQEAGKKGFSVSRVDGVRLAWPDGWALVRASNTQPVLVLRFEAGTAERMESIRSLVQAALERAVAVAQANRAGEQ